MEEVKKKDVEPTVKGYAIAPGHQMCICYPFPPLNRPTLPPSFVESLFSSRVNDWQRRLMRYSFHEIQLVN